jgi:hypothetical protein
MQLRKGISPAVLCIGGITVVVLGTAVWYLFIKKKKGKSASVPVPVIAVESVSEVFDKTPSVGGSDLLSKLKSLPSSSRSRSRV